MIPKRRFWSQNWFWSFPTPKGSGGKLWFDSHYLQPVGAIGFHLDLPWFLTSIWNLLVTVSRRLGVKCHILTMSPPFHSSDPSVVNHVWYWFRVDWNSQTKTNPEKIMILLRSRDLDKGIQSDLDEIVLILKNWDTPQGRLIQHSFLDVHRTVMFECSLKNQNVTNSPATFFLNISWQELFTSSC